MHSDHLPGASWLRARLGLLGWAPLGRSPAGPDPATLRDAEVRALAIAWLRDVTGPRGVTPDDLSTETGQRLYAQLRAAVSRLEPLGWSAGDRGSRFAVVGGKTRVQAELLRVPSHVWSTSRGELLVGLRGDYLLYTDDRAAGWTLIPQVFADRYRPLGGNRFERTGVVYARHHDAAEPREVLSPEGPMLATRGDWILTSDAGDWWVRSGPGFREGYRPVSEAPPSW